MPLYDPEQPVPDELSLLTRRRLLLGGAIGAGAAIIAPAALLAYQYDDDDDDRDSSGKDGDDSDHDHDDRDSSGEDDGDSVPITGTVPEGSIEVRITDDDADGFEPSPVTIDAGQSITWVNADDDPHTATGGAWDTGIIQPGGMATVTFDEPGSFAYSCQVHPVMSGVVEVRNAEGVVPEASPVASPVASPTASPVAGAAVEIAIVEFAFSPATAEVAAGSTVTWANADQVPHTATSTDGTFDTGTLQTDQTGSVTFDTPGTFAYQCAIHPSMTGTIVVS